MGPKAWSSFFDVVSQEICNFLIAAFKIFEKLENSIFKIFFLPYFGSSLKIINLREQSLI